MEEVLASARSRPRFLTTLLGLFSATALVLAAVGLYGVISYSVTRRTTEFGIRAALGAQPGQVRALVVGQGLRLAAVGVVVGTAGSLLATRALASLLFGVTPHDPLTFIAGSLVLLLVAFLASYLPARRAMRLNPVEALRSE